MERIGFGGGCHWCTEAVFQNLIGVRDVNQGFIASDPPNETFSEAVDVAFDRDTISLEVLIEIHLRTHASTSQHSMRGKYRSAVYVHDEAQRDEARQALDDLQGGFDKKLITQVLWARQFKASDQRFHNYYKTDPERPFCQAYIDPKLKILREQFSERFAG